MSDPRLADLAILSLAAVRLQHRQGSQMPDWPPIEGLHALLESARQPPLPRRDPWDLPPLDATSALAHMLEEARARQEGGHHGA